MIVHVAFRDLDLNFQGQHFLNVSTSQTVRAIAKYIMPFIDSNTLTFTGSGRREHITQTLKRLHWLPAKHRIDYKIAAMTFKARQTGERAYLKNHSSPTTFQRVH